MKDCLFRAGILLTLMVSFGCAKKGVGPTTLNESAPYEAVQLECKSPHRNGCRHQGQILPWNEWVAVLGYSKEKYTVTKRQPSGSKLIVTIERR